MKKFLCLLMVLMMTFFLAGCGSKDGGKTPETSGSTGKDGGSTPAQVDVDLTKLSSTMVYSEVYHMLTEPEDYEGKTVRMKGPFAKYQPKDANGQPYPDIIYFACIIADATACCSQGLEFVLEGNPKYPEDYPTLGTEITVVGEFRTYIEGQYQYCHLVNAVVE